MGTAAQFSTIGYINQLGLTESEVEQVHMEYCPSFQAFVAGEGDLISISPPYSYDCIDAGFVQVASFEDATNVLVVDGCFGRNEVVENRREEVELFLKVLVRAMDALQDEQKRFGYSIKKYHDKVQEFTDENLWKEIADRAYGGHHLHLQAGLRIWRGYDAHCCLPHRGRQDPVRQPAQYPGIHWQLFAGGGNRA